MTMEAFWDDEGESIYVKADHNASEAVIRESAREHLGLDDEDLVLETVYMQEIKGSEALDLTGDEYDTYWMECSHDLENAKPHWKVSVV